MIRINATALLVALLMTFVGCINRNKLPAQLDTLPALTQEPTQRKIEQSAFDVGLEDVAYRVQPLYDYELTGLVVSYRHHDGNRSLHKRWNDHLNMLDVCVVWSGTAASGVLDRLKFWNGVFTCNVQTRDNEAWSRFDMAELSNNHLISADPSIRRAVRDVAVGDQIRIAGWLSEYSANGGPVRGTSIRRDDTGNGACETIYVHDFERLSQGRSGWRDLLKLGMTLTILCTIVHFILPHRPR